MIILFFILLFMIEISQYKKLRKEKDLNHDSQAVYESTFDRIEEFNSN